MLDVPSHLVITSKVGARSPSPDGATSFTGTIINNSSSTLLFDADNSSYQPPQTELPAKGGKTNWYQDGGGDSNGRINWTISGKLGDKFGVYWDVPWIGSNQVGYGATPPLNASQSGSTSGWNLDITWTVVDA